MAPFPTAVERRGGGRAANRRRSRSPPPTASTLYFPPELIPEVARHLTSLQDFFALRAVCRAFRAHLPLTRSNLASQAPLLLFPLRPCSFPFHTVSFALFHPTLRRIHRFRFHTTPYVDEDGGHTVASFHSFGCRLVVNESKGLAGQESFSIVNLFTGEQTFLSSPPNDMGSPSRVLLYSDLILTWHWSDDGRTIQYRNLNAADWRVASIIEPYGIVDLVCVNGVLYALVTPGYILAIVKLSENKNTVELVLLGGNLDASIVRVHEEHFSSVSQLHLTDCCGELILISNMEDFPRVYHVFRWKFGEAKWERIANLGGRTLFLTEDCCVGYLGPHHKGIRGDSIYITERRDWVDWDRNGDWYEYSLDDGSFNKSLDDGSFNRFFTEYPGGWCYTPSYYTPIWVLPSMY
ncbi:unnamed protein product [Urochloa decumbens]